MNITDFLLARIAEDEATAGAAGHQKLAGPFHGKWRHDSVHLSSMERKDAAHIARWDPVRVLAECAAKRAIVATQSVSRIAAVPSPMILRAFATVYADHPDFREEWKL